MPPGLSPSAAKYRWAGDDDAIAERQEASRRRKRDRPSSVPTDLPGESVAEAAKRLGVTAQAIYQRVNRGQLEARTIELPDGRRYKRVFAAADEADPTASDRDRRQRPSRRARSTPRRCSGRPRTDRGPRAPRARRGRAGAASPGAARGCRAAATCRSPRSRSTPTPRRPVRRGRTSCGTPPRSCRRPTRTRRTRGRRPTSPPRTPRARAAARGLPSATSTTMRSTRRRRWPGMGPSSSKGSGSSSGCGPVMRHPRRTPMRRRRRSRRGWRAPRRAVHPRAA